MRKEDQKINSYFHPIPKRDQKNRESLRLFYKKRVQSLSPPSKKQKQKQIIHLLNQFLFWEKAHFIAGYRALKDEPDLSLFYESWKEKMCFPLIQGDVLEFYKYSGKWKKNQWGISEPLPNSKNKISLEEISVFLVPGRVFDRKGGRLGRGQGFYDKTLMSFESFSSLRFSEKWTSFMSSLKFSRKKRALFIGVAFSDQIHNESLKLFSHDILMDILVTDCFAMKSFIKDKTQKNNM